MFGYNYEAYDEIMRKSSSFWILIILAFLFLFILLFLGKPFKKDKKIVKILISTFVGIVFACLVGFFGYKMYEISADIENHSYVIYEGEFSVGKYEKYSISIPINGKVVVLDGMQVIKTPSGRYYGKVVYSERSRCLVDYQVVKELN